MTADAASPAGDVEGSPVGRPCPAHAPPDPAGPGLRFDRAAGPGSLSCLSHRPPLSVRQQASRADDKTPQLVGAVTLMAGVLFLVLAVLKMGWISRFLSKAVITGFLLGAAIEVVVGELPKTTGTEVGLRGRQLH
nr:SulP family inorganic anion transporter [Candidatus Microthrix sp.]